MQDILKYFKGTIGFTLMAVAIGAFFLGGIKAAITILILAVLEISLSFDNAVVNAKTLENMDEIWKNASSHGA